MFAKLVYIGFVICKKQFGMHFPIHRKFSMQFGDYPLNKRCQLIVGNAIGDQMIPDES